MLNTILCREYKVMQCHRHMFMGQVIKATTMLSLYSLSYLVLHAHLHPTFFKLRHLDLRPGTLEDISESDQIS